MIHALRRHPFLTAAVTMPLVIVLALAGRFVALAQRRAAPVRVGHDRGSTVTKTASGRLHRPRPDAPVFILALGNDGRPGETSHPRRRDPPHRREPDDCARRRSSTSPATPASRSRATAPTRSTPSHVYGGAALQAETLGNAVGVQVPYAIDTDFAGFVAMVDDMGGLEVNVPEAMNDDDSGADFPRRAAEAWTADQALAFAPQPPPVPHRRPAAAPRTRATSSSRRSRSSGPQNTGPGRHAEAAREPRPPRPARGHRPQRPLHPRPARPVDRPGERAQRRRPDRGRAAAASSASAPARRRSSPTSPTTRSSRRTSGSERWSQPSTGRA